MEANAAGASPFLKGAKYLTDGEEDVPYLTVPFIKRYILYAKRRFEPELTEEASKIIVEAYANFRQRRDNEDGPREEKVCTLSVLRINVLCLCAVLFPFCVLCLCPLCVSSVCVHWC